jgi:hypothetical protein
MDVASAGTKLQSGWILQPGYPFEMMGEEERATWKIKVN